MGSKWRKAKLALGLKLCVFVPRTLDESPPPSSSVDDLSERLSNAALLSPSNWDACSRLPMTPTPSSHGLRLSRSGSKSSKVFFFFRLFFIFKLLLVKFEMFLESRFVWLLGKSAGLHACLRFVILFACL